MGRRVSDLGQLIQREILLGVVPYVSQDLADALGVLVSGLALH